MRRIWLFTAVVGLMLPAASVVAGTDDGAGAQKRQLVARNATVAGPCQPGPATASNSAQPTGFVILNSTGQPGEMASLIGQISLKNGASDATYNAFLQALSGFSAPPGFCQMPVGMLSTNNQGNGNLHFEVPEVGPTNSYWIVLKQMPAGATEFASAPALVD